jgi:galactokinase
MSFTSPDDLRAAFQERFGLSATAIVRAPGRVNLVGEHTDYSNLPVLPVAIAQGLSLAVASAGDNRVEAASTAFEGTVEVERVEPIRASGAGWGRYLAGALSELRDVAPGRGARVLVDADLPAGGGLSSSSALTTAVLAALDAAWDAGFDRDELVRRAIVAERHVGVESGGMDQTVIVFAEAGNALRIDFQPPALRLVPLPDGLALVAAYSGEESAKGGNARDAYNERVVGARIAAAMLADQIGVDIDNPPVLASVIGLDVVDILADELPDRVSAQEVAHGVPVSVEHLVRLTAGRYDHMAKVPVKRIARHILSEADRVDRAEEALLAGDIDAFGRLLNESHNSLREDFRCSTPALDRLCAAMRKAGAVGARLTGAGFGGYAIAAARPEQVRSIIEAAHSATGGPAFEVIAADGLKLL